MECRNLPKKKSVPLFMRRPHIEPMSWHIATRDDGARPLVRNMVLER